MLGFKTTFATLTRGEGLLNRAFLKYDAHKGAMDGVRKGVLVATEEGKATSFSIGGCPLRCRRPWTAVPLGSGLCGEGL
jgi:GTP-binding protein